MADRKNILALEATCCTVVVYSLSCTVKLLYIEQKSRTAVVVDGSDRVLLFTKTLLARS